MLVSVSTLSVRAFFRPRRPLLPRCFGVLCVCACVGVAVTAVLTFSCLLGVFVGTIELLRVERRGLACRGVEVSVCVRRANTLGVIGSARGRREADDDDEDEDEDEDNDDKDEDDVDEAEGVSAGVRVSRRVLRVLDAGGMGVEGCSNWVAGVCVSACVGCGCCCVFSRSRSACSSRMAASAAAMPFCALSGFFFTAFFFRPPPRRPLSVTGVSLSCSVSFSFSASAVVSVSVLVSVSESSALCTFSDSVESVCTCTSASGS